MSCHLAFIVFEQTAQPFSAAHFSSLLSWSAQRWNKQYVILALVVSLLMIMNFVMMQCPFQGPLPKQD
jgi:fucose permease